MFYVCLQKNILKLGYNHRVKYLELLVVYKPLRKPFNSQGSRPSRGPKNSAADHRRRRARATPAGNVGNNMGKYGKLGKYRKM